MIHEKRLLKIIHSTHISEKSKEIMKKFNILTLKVKMKSNKKEIKKAVQKIFLVKVKSVNTLSVKKKTKNAKKHKVKKWKKVYILLKEGQKTNIINNLN